MSLKSFAFRLPNLDAGFCDFAFLLSLIDASKLELKKKHKRFNYILIRERLSFQQ